MLFLCIKYDLSIEHLQLLTISSIVALSVYWCFWYTEVMKKHVWMLCVETSQENSTHVKTTPLYSVYSGNGSRVIGVRWLQV